MKRQLKFMAAVSVVLVTLSGFAPARKGGGDFGGCSSHSSSSHSDTDYDAGDGSGSDYGSGGSGSGGHGRFSKAAKRFPVGTEGGYITARITKCVDPQSMSAEVQVENHAPGSDPFETYQLHMKFLDAEGNYLSRGAESPVMVEYGKTETTTVIVASSVDAEEIGECVLVSVED